MGDGAESRKERQQHGFVALSGRQGNGPADQSTRRQTPLPPLFHVGTRKRRRNILFLSKTWNMEEQGT